MTHIDADVINDLRFRAVYAPESPFRNKRWLDCGRTIFLNHDTNFVHVFNILSEVDWDNITRVLLCVGAILEVFYTEGNVCITFPSPASKQRFVADMNATLEKE